ncbi:uncharacterized protein LOC127749631 isoform X1 [Frankliniella occidentalis]|uniref:Uncharacterized protein LOC127749631 isoform X1 n=1 Tax=Frankliniella occidentalis TaxID=133901 RepID=A0A9C6TY84_FRAOC|nr:uncharacterized protein LOC127749631 isoform X1 [Frankliniella occidentalis]XP_052124522.1 uncharacterized protein LOC127749631 isoform X1 [Frankliniella occidentalis]XP_052124523.1 uncharacterized protein LOC127749631 isoform X1 [Frankliniella occidentalis]XP_052124524.1 uncharacterized protein LOC127749631 isoform X1 [Frankliniella occidentalis]XP_052124525.1 uncharacterized protein LOC127749631 isoform X1 [Frankliniella occidentalis]XP_052124526.1 uncharacterized protein LOC127749631 iso
MPCFVTMEQLPDDVIVAVMQFLSVEDLFACRLVSRRLCGLVSHWDVWRDRSLSDDLPCANAVLRLAPCLDALVVTGRYPTLAVTTTQCAVAILELHIFDRESFNDAEYALTVHRQESLGRLRRLELTSNEHYFRSPPVADVLVRTMASCSGLQSLEVCDSLPNTNHPIEHGPSKPSLTQFGCPIDEQSKSFVHTMLAGHAATLEDVDISDSHYGIGDSETAGLLASMPRLRRLRCNDSVEGFGAVAASKSLRDVSITLFGEPDEENEAVEFLRRAKQLRRIRLSYCTDFSAEFCGRVSEALTSSMVSKVERLALDGFTEVRLLFRELPSLPYLHHLELTEAPPDDELLLSISPETAPALRRLELGTCGQVCPHSWVHRDAVRVTLAANPKLHILLWHNKKDCGQACEACRWTCHPEVIKWSKVRKVGLFSHDPGKCPSPEDHTDTVEWQRSNYYTGAAQCPWIHM